MTMWPQDRYWHIGSPASNFRTETHFDGRTVRCYADRPRNLYRLLSETVSRFSHQESVVTENQRVTYLELQSLVERVGAGLIALGLAPGDRAALLCSNHMEFVVTFLACNRQGLICTLINTRNKMQEIEFILNDCSVAALIFDSDLADNIPSPNAVPQLKHRIVIGDSLAGTIPFGSLLDARSGILPFDDDEETTAFILYTSGTTGRPKGALLTHLGIIHSALTLARCLQLTSNDRSVISVPISHVTGLVGVFLSTVAAGGCNVLMKGPYKTSDFLRLAADEHMTFTIAVPAIYTLCVNEPNFSSYDLSAWRIGCFGGAPMPEATIKALAEKLPALTLINSYGATEATSPAVLMPPGEGPSHLDSAGCVVPCDEIVVVDQAGNRLSPGEHGELWIRGPNVVPGYWSNASGTAASFTDGFWRSGDIGSVDAAGFVRIFDRIKDMINRGGFKVFSAEVENILSAHQHVLECAVVGRPDRVLGERVHAFVVPRAGASPDIDELRAFCAERLADYKVPESVDLLAEPLPRNSSGKVLKNSLRDRMAGAELPRP
jgi:acyl-CoA synthetase (AMP-forming)/AMP-acid ligase II